MEEEAASSGHTDWANFKRKVYHDCMAKVFKSIIGPSQNGMLVSCADNISRRIFPYIQDLSADMEEMFANVFYYRVPG